MGRVSRADADRHREEVVTAAARLFREYGVGGVSVADIMAEVGLTQGGFYRQFHSKDALAAEATGQAFDEVLKGLTELADRHRDDRERARQELVEYYLSPDSRDFPGSSCPATAFGGDVTRAVPTSALRPAYVDGIRDFVDVLGGFDSGDVGREEHLATMCTLVGALYLARATAPDPVSDEILASARSHILGTLEVEGRRKAAD